jgi:hypothetical protein
MLVHTFAMWLCFRLHAFDGAAFRRLLAADMCGYALATLLLWGNTVYVSAFYVPFCAMAALSSIWAPASLSLSFPAGDKPSAAQFLRTCWRVCTFVAANAAATAAVLVASGLLKLASGAALSAVGGGAGLDDDHIFALLRCKVYGAGPQCHDFFSLLYLCENVFGYATRQDASAVTHLLLLPAAAVHATVTLGRALTMQVPDGARPPAAELLMVFLSVGYTVLAVMVSRLKVWARPRPQRTLSALHNFCMGFLYGRDGRLTAKTGGVRPGSTWQRRT